MHTNRQIKNISYQYSLIHKSDSYWLHERFGDLHLSFPFLLLCRYIEAPELFCLQIQPLNAFSGTFETNKNKLILWCGKGDCFYILRDHT